MALLSFFFARCQTGGEEKKEKKVSQLYFRDCTNDYGNNKNSNGQQKAASKRVRKKERINEES